MSYQERLSAEINAMLDGLAAENKPWNVTWIVHAICSKHDTGLTGSKHADFWRHGAYDHCRNEVQHCINQRAAERPEQAERQFPFTGQEHLQSCDALKRAADELGIAAVDLPDENAEANAFRAMGATCDAHAAELERFLRLRHSASSPSSES